MARFEAEREDLLAEARALVERVEISGAPLAEPVVLGFRRQGALSIYFGPDFVLQFNTGGELRRGFSDGKLLSAEARQLIELTRIRTQREVQLVRRAMTVAETDGFCRLADQRLEALQTLLRDGTYQIIGEVPPDAGVLDRGLAWLTARAVPMQLATRPHVISNESGSQ